VRMNPGKIVQLRQKREAREQRLREHEAKAVARAERRHFFNMQHAAQVRLERCSAV
jgi:hypothetical protein